MSNHTKNKHDVCYTAVRRVEKSENEIHTDLSGDIGSYVRTVVECE